MVTTSAPRPVPATAVLRDRQDVAPATMPLPGRDRGDAFDPECPTRVVLDRIGDKWTALVVGSLTGGVLRFSELRAAVGGVAPKVLTQTLRALERDGLVTRTVHAQVPPRVDYELTDLGRSLGAPLATLTDWAETHVAEIIAARDRFEEASSQA